MIDCLLTESRCFRVSRPASPIGIVVHSTGADNPWLKRYVQPSKTDPDREKLLRILGYNANGNSWNRDMGKSAHYMIGKLIDGTVETVRLLPEEICAWGSGSGKKGSCNYNPTAHIQFEICEDALTDENYFNACYRAAVRLCADICRRRGWEASVILSHREAARRGLASNHADVDHWLKKYGLTMNDLRADTDRLLHPEPTPSVGDEVSFIGLRQYRNANALIGRSAKPCRAVIRQIWRPGKARHPYLLKGPSVNGWTDAGSFLTHAP